MAINKQIKNLKGRLNDNYIEGHYVVPYSINSTSRYKHIDELKLIDSKKIKATLGPIDLNVYPYDGTTEYVVTSADENRIDIISYKIYGTSSLYWVLCYMNLIEDPLNIPVGTVLFVPSISSLKRFPNPLS